MAKRTSSPRLYPVSIHEPPPKRPRRGMAKWTNVAAMAFAADLPRQELVLDSDIRPRRDIKGWTIRLLGASHAQRWATLAEAAEAADAAAAARAVEAAVAARAAEATEAAGDDATDPETADRATAAAATTATTTITFAAGHGEVVKPGKASLDTAVVAQQLTAAIIHAADRGSPGECSNTAAANAHRQSRREERSVTLVRIVDIALAVRALRRARVAAPAVEMAAAFRRLVAVLRALRRCAQGAGDDAEAIEACLVEPAWSIAFGGAGDAVQVIREAVLRAIIDVAPEEEEVDEDDPNDKNSDWDENKIMDACLRSEASLSHVSDGTSASYMRAFGAGPCSIVTAALLADYDRVRALGLADRAIGLNPQAVDRIRNGAGPLPLKYMRMVLFCDAAMKAGQQSERPEAGRRIMRKLSTLFVAKDWHNSIVLPKHWKVFGETKIARTLGHQGNDVVHKVSPRNKAVNAALAGNEDELDIGLVQSELVPDAEDIAISFARSHADRGNYCAMYVLGMYILESAAEYSCRVSSSDALKLSAITAGKEYLQRASDHGDVSAPVDLGNLYKVRDSESRALRYYKQAIDRGSARAALAIGIMYLADANALPERANQAISFFRVAMHRGNAMAALQLAYLWHYGKHGIEKNYTKAKRCYMIAAERGRREHSSVDARARVGRAKLILDEARPCDNNIAKRLCEGVVRAYGDRIGVDGLSDAVLGDRASVRSSQVRSICASQSSTAGEENVPVSVSRCAVMGVARIARTESMDNAKAAECYNRPWGPSPLCSKKSAVSIFDAEDKEVIVEAIGDAIALLARILGETEGYGGHASRLLEQVVQLECKASAQALFDLGLVKLDAKDEDAAYQLFVRASSDKFKHPRAPNNVGVYLSKRGETDLALWYFERGASLGDDRAAANAAHLNVSYKKDIPRAIRLYGLAIVKGNVSAPRKLADVLNDVPPRHGMKIDVDLLKKLCANVAVARGKAAELSLAILRDTIKHTM
jgi:TPR repeat protein